MASEINLDTISEKTSAGGVTIDGLTIKDGNINESFKVVGTTPTLTMGDAGAEDTAIVFDGNAKDFYVALDDSADKLVIGEGSTVGTNSILTITDDSVTIGDAAAVDTKLVFDGNAQDYYVGLDDSADTLAIGLGSTVGTTPAITINSSQVATFAQNPVFPDGGVAVADLDIDGATDIGAAIVDADLFIIDDGAGGTNRKVTASRIKTYAGGGKWDLIANSTASDTATISVTGMNDADYEHFLITFSHVVPADDNVGLQCDFLNASNTAYSNYAWASRGNDESNTEFNLSSTSASIMDWTANEGSAAYEDGVSGQIWVHNPHVSKGPTYNYNFLSHDTAGDVRVLMGAGRGQNTAGPANGMTFQFTSGDIESGEIRMYGLKTA